MTGRRMGVDEAQRLGFVNRVVPRDDLMAEARKTAEKIIAGAPLAVAALLEATRATEVLSDQAAFQTILAGLPARDRMRASNDFNEGPRAFAEKRAPRWTGK